MSESGNFNSFSTNRNSSFNESNSLVSKFAFLIFVIFAFIILLRVGISIISYFLQPNQSPHLMDGMIDATQMVIYPQDPSSNGAIPIYRSNNAVDGIEFTWSVWIFINNLYSTNAGIYKHIFSKGNSNLQQNGLIYPNNAPGMYIAPDTNALVVMMNTFNVINEEVVIPDIPISKWVNVIIRCQNTTLDVYINGTISRSGQGSGRRQRQTTFSGPLAAIHARVGSLKTSCSPTLSLKEARRASVSGCSA